MTALPRESTRTRAESPELSTIICSAAGSLHMRRRASAEAVTMLSDFASNRGIKSRITFNSIKMARADGLAHKYLRQKK
jgi:hypothetical protein